MVSRWLRNAPAARAGLQSQPFKPSFNDAAVKTTWKKSDFSKRDNSYPETVSFHSSLIFERVTSKVCVAASLPASHNSKLNLWIRIFSDSSFIYLKI